MLLNEADALYLGDTAVNTVYAGDTKVWPAAPPSGGLSGRIVLNGTTLLTSGHAIPRTYATEGSIDTDATLVAVGMRWLGTATPFTGRIVVYRVSDQALIGSSEYFNQIPPWSGTANPAVDIPLITPVLMEAGVLYRIGSYDAGVGHIYTSISTPIVPLESTPPGITWTRTLDGLWRGPTSANGPEGYPGVNTIVGTPGWELIFGTGG